MQDINLTHPLTAAIATGATIAVVDDIETAIAWLDTHGGTQSLTRTGDTIAGVFLGIDFSIRLINKTNHSMNITPICSSENYVILCEQIGELIHTWRIERNGNIEFIAASSLDQAATFTRSQAYKLTKYFSHGRPAGQFCVLTKKQAEELFAANV